MRIALSSRGGRCHTEDLRRAWQARSEAQGLPMGGWDDPANGVLLQRLAEHSEPGAALADVARARYEAGFTFAECSADLRNLRLVLPRSQTRGLAEFDMMLTIGDVFLEAAYRDSAPTSSGLPDEVYLQQRIREAYRPGQRRWPWALGVVRLPELPDRFAAMLRRLEVVPVVRGSFAAAATLGTVGEDCFVALTVGERVAAAGCDDSERRLRAQGIAVDAWVQTLPADPLELDRALLALKRPC